MNINEIKQDPYVIDSILVSCGYYLQKEKLVKGRPCLIYALPEQKTGALHVWQADNGFYLFKDYSPYLEGKAGSAIDLVMRINHLSQDSEGVKEALRTIKRIANITDTTTNEGYSNNERILRAIEYIKQPLQEQKSSVSTEILKKVVMFNMEKIEQYFPKVYSYLIGRGIHHVKKLEIYKIKTTFNNEEESKEWIENTIGLSYGITLYFEKKEQMSIVPKQGVELRSINPKATYKTISCHPPEYIKTPSILISQKRKNLLFFESYIDYLTMQYLIDGTLNDVIVLNGTGLFSIFADEVFTKVVEIDKMSFKSYENIDIYEQNDNAGKELTSKLIVFFMDNYPASRIRKLEYTSDEEGMDINDLVTKAKIDAADIFTRFVNVRI